MNANPKTAAKNDTSAEDPAAETDAADEVAAPEADAADPAPTEDADPAAAEAEPGPAESDDRLQSLDAELAETKDRMMRAMAEVENTRRRAEREKQEASKYAISSFAREMLSVADNLRRALASVDDEVRNASDAVKTLLEGVEMTERELQKTLERQGIQRIEAHGKQLDPNLHEAMFEIPDESQPQGTVVQVVEDGYTLNDRLLRPAKVGVAKGGPKPQPKGEAQPAAATDAEGGAGKSGASAYETGGAGAGKTYDQEL